MFKSERSMYTRNVGYNWILITRKCQHKPGSPTRLSSGSPPAQEPKFKISLPGRLFQGPLEYACQVLMTLAQRSRSLKVFEMLSPHGRTDGHLTGVTSHSRERWIISINQLFSYTGTQSYAPTHACMHIHIEHAKRRNQSLRISWFVNSCVAITDHDLISFRGDEARLRGLRRWAQRNRIATGRLPIHSAAAAAAAASSSQSSVDQPASRVDLRSTNSRRRLRSSPPFDVVVQHISWPCASPSRPDQDQPSTSQSQRGSDVDQNDQTLVWTERDLQFASTSTKTKRLLE